MHPQDFLSVFHGFILFLLYGSCTAQRRGLGRGGNQVVDFDCPEEFGYYPHPTDCTQYYVCVFGGALLESCTGGLMYSHELQTCDWPRNVGCGANGGDSGTISTVRVTDPRTRTPPQQSSRSNNPQQSLQSQVQQSNSGNRISQREEALRQRQAQEAAHVQQQQQVVYEDELGPAEEVETDRQQRVYRGQPSTLGQVQRDRDGLRVVKTGIHTPNIIPSGPGTAEKVSLVSYNSQRVSQPRQQDQYSNELTDLLTGGVGNLSLTETNFLDEPPYEGPETHDTHVRRKRQAVYRLSGLPGRTIASGSQGQNNRKIPIFLIPETQPSRSQYSQTPPSSYGKYGHSHSHPTRTSRPSISYSSQNHDNFQIVHHNFHTGSGPEQVHGPQMMSHILPIPSKYSAAHYSEEHDQPSESQYGYDNKFIHAPPSPISSPPKQQQKQQQLYNGFDFEAPFRERFRQQLFQPANNTRPDLDIIKLTKGTIQTAFRPIRPNSATLEKFNPNQHTFPENAVPPDFYQSLLESSKPVEENEDIALVPTTTPRSIYMEPGTRAPNVRPPFVTVPSPSYAPDPPTRPPSTKIPYKPTLPPTTERSINFNNYFTLEPSVELPVDSSLEDLEPTRVPLFEPAPVTKRKKKKTTTAIPPTLPPTVITKNYNYNVSLFSHYEPEHTTLRPKYSSNYKMNPNDHRFYVPPATSAPTTARPTTTTRRKPYLRYRSTTTTRPPPTTTTLQPPQTSTSKKYIPEEYYENFKPFPTQSQTPVTPKYKKRQRLRPTISTTTTTTKENEVTTMTVTNVSFNRSTTQNVRVEPAQEYRVTTPSTPARYNTSAQYQPAQYDQYYQLYDEDADLYRSNQYQQQPQQQQLQVPSSTARSPVQQYRGQSSYKQQPIQLEPQYEQPSQDYTDQDEQQYQELASPKPSRSEEPQENRRRDTLSESSIARPLVTNKTIKRSDSFDSSILAPPPVSPPTYLTPPSQLRSFYVDHYPKIQNKEALLPPKNGGSLAKKLNNFDSVFGPFFETSTPAAGFDRNVNAKAEPQTIFRSEIGSIQHEPIVENKPDPTTIRTPVVYQELPDKDFQAFFVEIEPRRPKTPSGFILTKPQDTVKLSAPASNPAVEITREEIVNPESQEIASSPRGPILSKFVVPTPQVIQQSRAQSPRLPLDLQAAVNPEVDVLPLRAPAVRFNPSAEDNFSFRRTPVVPPTTTTTPQPTTTTTFRPRAPTTEAQPRLIKNPTPYQFIIVSTETPAPFARNPENEHRTDNRLTFRPEVRNRNQFSESLVEVNGKQNETPIEIVKSISKEASGERLGNPVNRFTSRFASTTPVPTSDEIVKQYESYEEEEEKPKFPLRHKNIVIEAFITESPVHIGRNKIYASGENLKQQSERTKSSQESRERTENPASFERSRQHGSLISSSAESTESPVSVESTTHYSASSELTGRPISAERIKIYSNSDESTGKPVSAERPRIYSNSDESTARPISAERIRIHSGSDESTGRPVSGERTKLYSSSFEQEIRPLSAERTRPTSAERNRLHFSSIESTERPVSAERTRQPPAEVTRRPVSAERTRHQFSSVETTEKPASAERTRVYSSSVESTERPVSAERTRFHSSSVESSERPVSSERHRIHLTSGETTGRPVSAEKPRLHSSFEATGNPVSVEDYSGSAESDDFRIVADSVEVEPSTTTTTKRPIRIRTTTEAATTEYRKPSRKVIKFQRGELKSQRQNKIKRIRKPTTQSPEIEDSNDKSFTRENEIYSTIKPIIVGDDAPAYRNLTNLKFTVEDDAEFEVIPKSKAKFYSREETAFEDDETRVVRPAYQPINLDTLESAEDPIPPRPSTEPPSPSPTKPSRNPDHDRATTKPSRGRASLKPRLRTSTASPDSQPSVAHTPVRQRGGSSYNLGVGNNEITANRGTPAPSRGTRPTLKPSTAIVSKASEFIDIYRYPPTRPANLYATPIPDKSAAKCRKDVCLLPDCSCGGKEIPGGLSPEETPQLVLLTFDDSVNDLNKGLYADLFERGRVNPNGCPISATFYVSHEWTDYAQVQNLYANGHEMASHSVSHSFGEQFSQKKWTREIAGQREILAAYGGVRLEDIRGMRAPFLAVGGNKMFKMLHDSNFTYDSSMPIYENKPPSWPYTMDYKLFHDCMIPPCPTKSYPGVWEVPMVMWQDLNGGRCSMGDACSNPPTADGVYKMLIKNFERHFTSNRAPFGLFYHAAWFTHEHHKEGFIAFLDTIVNMPEVWLVTNWQALQWVRDPQPLSTVNNFPAFQCNEEKAKKCNNPKVCNLWHKSGVRYMRTCQPCPEVYPWTGKTGVRNSRVDNEIIDE